MAALLWANLINMYQPPNCDRSVLEKIVKQSYLPVLGIFEQNKGCSFTLNLPGSTVELLIRTGFGEVVKKIAALAERGQVDFTMTTAYQSLMSLQPDEDTDRQIETHNKICKRYFGVSYKPQGLYSPFLAYSQKVSKTGARFTLKWVAIDDSCFKGGGQNGYNSLLMDKSAGGILLMGCRRELSDSIGGSFWISNPPRSASEFLQKALKMTSRDKYVITAVEAQSFGYENSGRDGLLRALYRDNRLRPVSISQLRRHVKRKDFVRTVDGSAATRDGKSARNKPFSVWENDRNPIQKSLWKLFKLAVSEVKNASTRGDPQYLRARDMLDSSSAAVNWAMASCSPWWDPEYPRRASDDLAIAVFVLLSSSPKVKEDAIAMRVQIYEQIDKFEKSGERKKLQKSFFRANNINYDRYMKSR
jgi:alpha-amylase/alpha-mannosidase (GH57 family)